MNIERPLLQYHGGKWLAAPWIIGFFPPHRVYVEPFGGAASVLLKKKPSHTEIYNDLDDEVVNLFQVLRSKAAETLVRMVYLTPFSRREFRTAYEATLDPIERARRMLIRSGMGHGTAGHTGKRMTGFRSNAAAAGSSPAMDWAGFPDEMVKAVRRLRGVTIENMDAVPLMEKHDSRDTLFYVDPPYHPETRDKGNDYSHEMSIAHHKILLRHLVKLKGMVVLSGYDHPLYRENLPGWVMHSRGAHADGGRDRRECVWLNPHCAQKQATPGLLDEVMRPVEVLPDVYGDDVSYDQLVAVVQEKTGLTHGWQMMFARAANLNIMTVQSARIRGLVPPRWVAFAATLTPEIVKQHLPKVRWSDEMYERLWQLINDDKRYYGLQDMADILADEFAQPVTMSAVKPAKHRAKRRFGPRTETA